MFQHLLDAKIIVSSKEKERMREREREKEKKIKDQNGLAE